MLLEHGADMNVLDSGNPLSCSHPDPLFPPLSADAVCRFLDGETPLHLGANGDHAAAVRLLLGAGRPVPHLALYPHPTSLLVIILHNGPPLCHESRRSNWVQFA